MHPKDFFESPPPVNAGHCFVIMPYAEEFKAVYQAIEAALADEELRFVCHRADKVPGGGVVMDKVLEHVAKSEIVVADLTRANPNVFYELGIAHAEKDARSVILLTQTPDKLPFDVRPYSCIPYEKGRGGLKALREELVKAVKPAVETRRVFTVPRGGSYETEDVFDGDDGQMYSFSISSLKLGIGFVNYRLRVSLHPLNLPAEPLAEVAWQHRLGHRKPLPGVPGERWAVKLDAINKSDAVFCVCKPLQPAAG